MIAGAANSLAATRAYEMKKRDDRDTSDRCRALGISLIPAVAESFSGWGEEAQKAFKVLIQAKVNRSGQDASIVSSQFFEGLNIKIMRANARSLLTRIKEIDVAVEAEGHRRRARATLCAFE